MNKKLILAPLFALLGAVGCASPLLYVPGDAITAPFLYCTTNSSRASFVFGTLHVGSVDALPPYVLKALAQSKAVYTEATGSSLEHFTEAPSAYRRHEDEAPLSRQLTPGAYRNLQTLFKGKLDDAQLAELNVYGAFVLANHLKAPSENVIVRGQSGSMDTELEDKAKDAKVKLIGLDEQSEPIRGLVKIGSLEALLNDTVQVQANDALERMVRAYYAGNEQALHAVSQELNDATKRATVQERNQSWAETLKPALPNGVFAAVGAGHLFGEQGLIKILERNKISLKRVTSEDAYNRCLRR